jgi:hypothetical protein
MASRLRPITGLDRVKNAARGSARRTGRKVSTAYGNATSKPGVKAEREGHVTFPDGRRQEIGRVVTPGGKFGKVPGDVKESRRYGALTSANVGILGGATGGTIAGGAVYADKNQKQRNQISANQKKIRANNKSLSKRYTKITDLGSRAERLSNKVNYGREGFHGPALAGSAALIGAAVYGGHKNQNEQGKKRLARQQATLNRQNKKLVRKNMSESAFGIDHGDFSKAEKPKKPTQGPSAGRYAAGAAFGWAHGGVAGKKGHKLKAAGTSFGTGTVGNLAGAALTRSSGGGGLGQLGGNMVGTKIAHNKGWLKPQNKR